MDDPVASDQDESGAGLTAQDAGEATAQSSSIPVGATVGTTAVPSKRLEDRVLPGTPFDLFPYAGAALSVVGIEHNDVLNVRIGPGPEFRIVTNLASTSSDDAVATGRNRSVDSGIWAEIEIGDILGWANAAFMLQTGSVNDDTTNLYPTPQDHPVGESVEALGREVAGAYASLEPTSSITVIGGPSGVDVTAITLDVLGLGDDSVGGYRVHVFLSHEAEGYRVRNVETTTLCTRGVADGMCL